MRSPSLLVPLAILVATLAAGRLDAQGWIDPPERRPIMPRPGDGQVVRTGTTVRVRVEGRAARVEVEEWFRNAGGRVAEGSYLYPVPGDAVFTDFSLFQGDRELKGEMMNAEQAQGIYEEIVRRLKDPALLTLAGHGLIRAQVFPIQPGETRRVILRYTQLLDRAGDALRFRYAPGARGDAPINLLLSTAGTRLGTPWSPTHQVEWSREAPRRDMELRTSLRTGRDFELFLPVPSGLVSTSLVTHAPGGGGGERFFLLMVSPPAFAENEVLSRTLTLVTDVSGSMAGDKLDQAREALRQALAGLRSGDRFRLIAFSSTVQEFAPEARAATAANLRAARAFVDGLEARGGTNIEGALEAAFREPAADGRIGVVLFLTDGLPSVGEQDPERLAALAGARGRGELRVFPIGVGHDVNTLLLDRLAVEGRGRVEYVAPDASVETAVGNTLRRIDAPVLTGLRIVAAPAGVQLLEQSPRDLPDLFSGEELVVFGQYRGAGDGQVVIEGRRGGRRERFTAEASFPRHQLSNDFIPPLWAARRVGELTREARLEGVTPERIARIRELGMRYGILTEYTSYLVLEPEAAVAAQREAMAPAPASGEVAFRRAERSSALSEAKSLADAVVAPSEVLLGRGRATRTRQAGGRLFVERNGVWTDVAHTDSLQIVTIAPYSSAWFALARALPELSPWLGVGERVLVAGREVSIRVGPDGRSQLGSAEIGRLVRRFRGA